MQRTVFISALSASLAMAAPAAAHEFLDYFDYGDVNLSARGYQTAREVVGYTAGQTYRVVVTAYLDTAEAHEFSDELALRRAQSMASELVRLGVDPARIEMRSGGTRLAKPTPDNTREPLNRRLVVDLSLGR